MNDYRHHNMLVHAIILTLNEERHLERCIQSLRDRCATVTVIDSGSSDRTVDIARSMGALVLANSWTTHANQINFAIDALADRDGWLFRIDADEILQTEGRQSLSEAISEATDEVDGLLIKRRIYFQGHRIRYGGIEPSWQLRLWRNGKGRCEQRWMDEHMKVAGKVAKTSVILADINLNSLTWWTEKHNSYASREALETLNRKYGFMLADGLAGAGASAQARRKRIIKDTLYVRLPGGLRAAAYFAYRYFLRLGFLDGRAGWYFHFLQAFWYRTLVDAKISEIEDCAIHKGISIVDAIRDRTGICVKSSDVKRQTPFASDPEAVVGFRHSQHQ